VKQLFSFWSSLLLVSAVSMNAVAADTNTNAKFTTEKERLSYAIGVQIGGSLKQQGFTDIDAAAMGQAIADVLSGAKPQVSMEDMQAAIQSYQKKKIAEREAEGKSAKEAGDKFRAENAKKKGVKVTKSGIQYEVLKAGNGKKPTAKDTVTVDYTGKLINGKVFDSSVERGQPATFPLDGVIKGWTEILPMMKVGSKWRIVIPPELAYGDHGAGSAIGPNETLIFEIELKDIKKK
jgi:FKBP-type peptidyl-prolyl cis-trans isomerase FklB